MSASKIKGIDTSPIGLVFTVWKRVYGHRVWDYIKDKKLIDDWRQEAAKIAIQMNKKGITNRERTGNREAIKEISRQWYAFLRRYGLFKRDGKQWQEREEALSLHREKERELYGDWFSNS